MYNNIFRLFIAYLNDIILLSYNISIANEKAAVNH